VVATLSDIVIREINTLIMRRILNYKDVEVYLAFDEEPIVVYPNGFLTTSVEKAILLKIKEI
jgi:hypothetical protein